MLETSVCKEFVVNCPKITTLAVQTCILFPCVAFELVKVDYVSFSLSGSCRTHEYVNFLTCEIALLINYVLLSYLSGHDHVLLQGFNELKYVDFTNCFSLTGAFLE